MKPYFQKVDYEACEYNFITLYMWQTVYDFHYIKRDDYILLFGQSVEGVFSMMPLCEPDKLARAFDDIFEGAIGLNTH